MAIYRVQGPDGATYRIEGPDGATDEQLISVLKNQINQETTKEEPFVPHTTKHTLSLIHI